MADKYLNLSGLQAFYDELKSHYPTTGLKTFKSFDYGFTNGGAEFIDGTISASTSASTFGIFTLTNNLALSNTGNNLYISAKPYPTTAQSSTSALSSDYAGTANKVKVTQTDVNGWFNVALYSAGSQTFYIDNDYQIRYNPSNNKLSATNYVGSSMLVDAFTGKQMVTVSATACTTAVTANTKDTVNALSNPKLGFYDTDATQKGYILWTDYNNTNTWVNADSAFFGGTSITDGFVVTSDQLNSILVTKNLSATNFKANTISATTVSANLSGWSRSASTASYAVSAGAAPVASHQFSAHTNFSTYFDGTSAKYAKSATSATTSVSADTAARALGLQSYEYSKNGGDTEWLKIGTFRSNNNDVNHAGIEMLISMRDNGGQDGTYLIHIQQGEWDGNYQGGGANPNWCVVTLTKLDGRGGNPVAFTLAYHNTGVFGIDGGIELYARLAGYTKFTIRLLSWNYYPIPFDFDLSTKTYTEPTNITYVTPSRFVKSNGSYDELSAGYAQNVAGNYVKAYSNQNLTLATARSLNDMIATGPIYLVF